MSMHYYNGKYLTDEEYARAMAAAQTKQAQTNQPALVDNQAESLARFYSNYTPTQTNQQAQTNQPALVDNQAEQLARFYSNYTPDIKPTPAQTQAQVGQSGNNKAADLSFALSPVQGPTLTPSQTQTKITTPTPAKTVASGSNNAADYSFNLKPEQTTGTAKNNVLVNNRAEQLARFYSNYTPSITPTPAQTQAQVNAGATGKTVSAADAAKNNVLVDNQAEQLARFYSDYKPANTPALVDTQDEYLSRMASNAASPNTVSKPEENNVNNVPVVNPEGSYAKVVSATPKNAGGNNGKGTGGNAGSGGTTTQTPTTVNAPSQAVIDAENALASAQNAKPQGYASKYGEQLESILQQIQNPDAFKWDFNGDELFKMYADEYTQRGRQASMDAMGQAAALTGGYGNSYAQQVGNQAYDQYLTELYNRGFDLRDRAYEMWKDKQDNLYNQYSLLQNADETDYNRYINDRDYAANYVLAILQNGQMPSDELLAAAGLSMADAQKLMAQVSSGGGGGSGKSKTGDSAPTYFSDAWGNLYETDDSGNFKKVDKGSIKGEYNVDTRYANAETNIANTVQNIVDTWNSSQLKQDISNIPNNLLSGITNLFTGNNNNKQNNGNKVLVDNQEEYLKRFKKDH